MSMKEESVDLGTRIKCKEIMKSYSKLRRKWMKIKKRKKKQKKKLAWEEK